VDLRKIATQLQDTSLVPFFAGRVVISANVERIIGEGDVGGTPGSIAPAIYISELAYDASENTSRSGLLQLVWESLSIIALIPMSDNIMGSGTPVLIQGALDQIYRAILNWNDSPIRNERPWEFVGGHSLHVDSVRYLYQLVFRKQVLITDADGFQVGGPPLTEIDVNFIPPGPTFGFNILLPGGTGPTGPPCYDYIPKLLNGSGPPADDFGCLNDYYLDIITGNLYYNQPPVDSG
jgi:hypothetical protein